MPNYRCCVGGCNNDSRYSEKLVVKSHVTQLKFHYFPKDGAKRAKWVAQISKGLVGFKVSDTKVVCSNHFECGKPTFLCDTPTMYLTVSSSRQSTPRKRRKLDYKCKQGIPGDNQDPIDVFPDNDKIVQCNLQVKSALLFDYFTRNSDVKLNTGFSETSTFRLVFDQLAKKAQYMHYWKGMTNTAKDLSSPRDRKNINLRKLSLKKEFLMTMMRLRAGLMIDDIAFRFDVSNMLASSVFTTWLKFMSKELRWLIFWPDRNVIRRNLPVSFRKYYPRCSIIIDCSEIFTETPSSLDVAAMCWSNYKHHSTIKYLIGITPNGAISYVSGGYGGRASDIFIVNNSGFLNFLQPGDQVMVDRGFKIQDILNFHQCTLCILPSKHTNLQMTKEDVAKTSKIANV